MMTVTPNAGSMVPGPLFFILHEVVSKITEGLQDAATRPPATAWSIIATNDTSKV
jgi:hypothetical protein